MTIDYDRDQLSYALANALKERDEAMDAMETCRRVSRKDCEQNAKRAEELHVQNLTLERERDEALSQIVQAECRAERFCQERDEAREIIRMAKAKFCEEGSDGNIASEMFSILNV
jgi:hypothetical protein